MIGGYIPNGNALDPILVSYYEGGDLMFAAACMPASIEVPEGPDTASRRAADNQVVRSPICPNGQQSDRARG
jgi:hypothetical protein